MATFKFITENNKQTQRVGEIFAEEIKRTKSQSEALVVALYGDLGVGKTTFTQGFVKGLGSKEKVKSPTFVLMHEHKIKNKKIFHLDCYRIHKSKEIADLGFKEIVRNPENIILIEWAEIIKKILPKKRIEIFIKHKGWDKREITIKHQYKVLQ